MATYKYKAYRECPSCPVKGYEVFKVSKAPSRFDELKLVASIFKNSNYGKFLYPSWEAVVLGRPVNGSRFFNVFLCAGKLKDIKQEVIDYYKGENR